MKRQKAYRELKSGNSAAWFSVADSLKARDILRAEASRALGEARAALSEERIDEQILPWQHPESEKWFTAAGRYLSAFCAASFVARVCHIATNREQILPILMVKQW